MALPGDPPGELEFVDGHPEGGRIHDLMGDSRFTTNADRVAHRGALAAELEATLTAKPATEWFSLLSAVGVPCGPINDIGEAFALAESLGLDPVVQIESGDDAEPARQVANPINLSRTPVAYQSAPPAYRWAEPARR